MGEHQLQLTDAGGTVLAYSISSGSSAATPRPSTSGPWAPFRMAKRLTSAIYSMLRVRSEAAFDFRDVPLP